jgi:hypothetical protein
VIIHVLLYSVSNLFSSIALPQAVAAAAPPFDLGMTQTGWTKMKVNVANRINIPSNKLNSVWFSMILPFHPSESSMDR